MGRYGDVERAHVGPRHAAWHLAGVAGEGEEARGRVDPVQGVEDRPWDLRPGRR
ncbi:MAG: hypothetical protein WD423_12290 [Rhodothermales bacterium]